MRDNLTVTKSYLSCRLVEGKLRSVGRLSALTFFCSRSPQYFSSNACGALRAFVSLSGSARSYPMRADVLDRPPFFIALGM